MSTIDLSQYDVKLENPVVIVEPYIATGEGNENWAPLVLAMDRPLFQSEARRVAEEYIEEIQREPHWRALQHYELTLKSCSLEVACANVHVNMKDVVHINIDRKPPEEGLRELLKMTIMGILDRMDTQELSTMRPATAAKEVGDAVGKAIHRKVLSISLTNIGKFDPTATNEVLRHIDALIEFDARRGIEGRESLARAELLSRIRPSVEAMHAYMDNYVALSRLKLSELDSYEKEAQEAYNEACSRKQDAMVEVHANLRKSQATLEEHNKKVKISAATMRELRELEEERERAHNSDEDET